MNHDFSQVANTGKQYTDVIRPHSEQSTLIPLIPALDSPVLYDKSAAASVPDGMILIRGIICIIGTFLRMVKSPIKSSRSTMYVVRMHTCLLLVD